ncbi:Predicted N-formylglutamate amidohydrolase [Delftia tsuruhatensis]|uniref:N-formylglutamate deformylase n=1 Tax=Delftia tsuruhatensis TaxID=180282 RepID=UPI001E719B56|nr:N-formylglutamate deformylase [Delftia tsuruhatensis]CAB5681858.1 Predicted N-formylglutamate amidohydrolase [Delftia tsuruhatensis]CAC9675726.1 Predicted N-formylglutamate amidohydrolase [Delftia tsuruhatensis]
MTDITDIPAFTFHQGTAPLLLSMPHAGTHVPPAIAARLTGEARQVPDTDWHLPLLYAFARHMGASILVATHSRYVVDLNRPPDGASLYPGQSVTGLCPVDTFDDTPLYADPADVPTDAEIAARRDAVWSPYHAQLRAELDRLKAVHGTVALWDAHSIRSVLPRFFEGQLPDLNLGTGKGTSCALPLAEKLLEIAKTAPGHTSVLNGRFTGGYITRHYGQPEAGIHAVQLEMTQCSYMQEALPFDYLPERAARIQPTLQRMLQAVLDFVATHPR